MIKFFIRIMFFLNSVILLLMNKFLLFHLSFVLNIIYLIPSAIRFEIALGLCICTVVFITFFILFLYLSLIFYTILYLIMKRIQNINLLNFLLIPLFRLKLISILLTYFDSKEYNLNIYYANFDYPPHS